MKIHKFMKSLIRKIGLALALLAILKIGDAQVVDFVYYDACAGSSTHFVSTTTSPSSITRYRWFIGGDTTTISNNAEMEYSFMNPDAYLVTLEAYIGSILVDRKSKNVVIYEPPIADFLFENNCIGEAAYFEFIPTNDEDPNNDVEIWQWDFGDGSGEFNDILNPSHYFAGDGMYNVSLIVTSVRGCKDTMLNQIAVYPLPMAIIGGTLEKVCEGELVEIYVDDYEGVAWGASVPLTIDQVTNDTLRFLCPLGMDQIEIDVTVYEIHYSTQTICQNSASTIIKVNPKPDITVSSDQTMVLPGGGVDLSVSSGNTLVEYLWTPIINMTNPFSANPSVIVNRPTTFNVYITDENGCKNSGSIFIDVDLQADNFVSPNGDGHNDTWFARTGGLSDDYELVIFNRWGEEVLSQKGYSNDWDGTSNGDELPEGAYYYVIKQGDATYTGAITLLR